MRNSEAYNYYMKFLKKQGISPNDIIIEDFLKKGMGTPIERNNYFDHLTNVDIAISVIAGLIGGLIPIFTQSHLAQLHDGKNIHNSFLKKIFIHAKGSPLDKISKNIMVKESIPADIHRLFYGHDILSIKSDNPILLGLQTKGFPKGILSSFQHLFSDSFSTRGLPLPGTENFAHFLWNNWSHRSKDLYTNTLTLRASDVVGASVVRFILWLYRKIESRKSGRKTTGTYRVYEMDLIGFGTSTSVSIVLNRINWANFAGFITSYIRYFRFQGKITNEFCKEADSLFNEIKCLSEEKVERKTVKEYIDEFKGKYNYT
jgi:hypothetical protein